MRYVGWDRVEDAAMESIGEIERASLRHVEGRSRLETNVGGVESRDSSIVAVTYVAG